MRLALVTGASSGLGKAFAQLLARKNIPLILTARNEAALEEVAVELRKLVPVITHSCDLSQSRSSLLSLIQKHTPDLMVNNAGFGLYGEALNQTTEEQLTMVEVNNKALLELTLGAAHALRTQKKEGIILNVSSVVSHFPYPLMSVYAATKAFVTSLSQGLDVEMRPYGIRVLAACPGQIETGFQKHASKGYYARASTYVMNVDAAARHLWYQVEKRKMVYTFDWFYVATALITRFLLPRAIKEKILVSLISKKIPQHDDSGCR